QRLQERIDVADELRRLHGTLNEQRGQSRLPGGPGLSSETSYGIDGAAELLGGRQLRVVPRGRRLAQDERRQRRELPDFLRTVLYALLVERVEAGLRQPRGARGGRRQRQDLAIQLIDAQTARLPHGVQGADMRVETIPAFRERTMQLVAVWQRRLADTLDA